MHKRLTASDSYELVEIIPGSYFKNKLMKKVQVFPEPELRFTAFSSIVHYKWTVR